MSLTYTSYVSQIANLLTYTSTESVFTTMLPGMIDYAEQRMYRELDLLATRVTDTTGSLSSGNRNFALPTSVGTFLVVEGVNVITTSTQTSTGGTRVQLVNTSREFLDIAYPSNVLGQTTPEFFAMVDNANVIVGPPPDAPYNVEIIGTQRPIPLSSGNSSTILTQMLPDAFIAASMVFGTGFQKDFSAQGDNPQAGQSWEGQYTKLIQTANVEELRKKYQSQAWTNKIPDPLTQRM